MKVFYNLLLFLFCLFAVESIYIGNESRSKRFVNQVFNKLSFFFVKKLFFSSCSIITETIFILKQNTTYQECRTPVGSVGHCKNFQQCSLSEFKENIWKALNYLCLYGQS